MFEEKNTYQVGVLNSYKAQSSVAEAARWVNDVGQYLPWLSYVGGAIIAAQGKSTYIQATEIVDLLVAQERYDLIPTKQDYRKMDAEFRRNSAASQLGKRLGRMFDLVGPCIIFNHTISHRTVEILPMENGEVWKSKWYRFVREPLVSSK